MEWWTQNKDAVTTIGAAIGAILLLADHRITYQPRDPNRDTQAELNAALNRSRCLLVTASTGYGKTREAGRRARTGSLPCKRKSKSFLSS